MLSAGPGFVEHGDACMQAVHRGKRTYYYSSYREGDQVNKRYHGSGELAEIQFLAWQLQQPSKNWLLLPNLGGFHRCLIGGVLSSKWLNTNALREVLRSPKRSLARIAP